MPDGEVASVEVSMYTEVRMDVSTCQRNRLTLCGHTIKSVHLLSYSINHNDDT